MTTPKPRALLKIGLLILFVGCAMPLARTLDLRGWIEGFDPVIAPLVYIGVYILGTVLLMPGTLLSFAGALLFGPYLGTLYTWIGATIGATLAFLLARFLGRAFVEQLLAGRFQEFQSRVERHGFTSLLILRLLPWFPFNGINFASGLTGVRLRDYVLATAIGILPGTFVYQFLFAKLGDKALQNDWHWSDLTDPALVIALVLFVVFIALGRWLARRLRSEPRS